MSAVSTDVQSKSSVLLRMAERFGVDPDKMMATLRATAFKGNATVEQLMALCVVAEQYNLNPWTKEIYAFPSQGGVVPVVGVDGWSRIINSNPAFDGMDFEQDAESCTCRIHRKDRAHPIQVTEWMSECARPGQGPWQTHPKRMLRHKAMIQCARLAFGFVGIYDEDEAERIIDVTPSKAPDPRGDLSDVDGDLVNSKVSEITDLLNQDKDEYQIANDLREYVEANLARFNELYICVLDQLKKQKIISKANWDKMLKLFPNEEGRMHEI